MRNTERWRRRIDLVLPWLMPALLVAVLVAASFTDGRIRWPD